MQVSDVAWIDEKPYDGSTGEGAIGVEFATTAVTSEGFGGTIASAEEEAASYSGNPELQWNEGYYRGYYELQVRQNEVLAKFFGKSPTHRVPLIVSNTLTRLSNCRHPE